MERGNGRPEYRVPRYRPVVTPLLVAAWEYGAPMAGFAADGEFLIRSGADLRELARAACGYALVAAQRNDLRDADRAAWAAIGAGFKVIGDWPVEDSPGEGKLLITALVGKAIVAIGYTCLQKVYEQARDSAKAERVAAEYAAFKQRSDAHGKIVRENLSRHPVEIMLRSY